MAETETKASGTARPGQGERLLAWWPDDGLVPAEDVGGDLLAADSWLVHDGRVRGIERHAKRFFRACTEAAAVPEERLSAFWQDVLMALPRAGSWFPRVELGMPGSARLRVRLRPAPPRAAEVRVWVGEAPDPRIVPRRKGPDLAVLAGMRREASGHGAQEALLTTPSGLVLEAANSSILWWEEETLCIPSPSLPVLAGVTTGLIQQRALLSGVDVAHRRRTLPHLDGREVWLVNALHGIRPVTGWTGRALHAGPAPRAAEWREWLEQIAEPLTVG